MPEASQITLDDLAAMMKTEFDGINEKFDGINEKFDGINEKIDARFDELKRDLDEVKMKFAYVAWAIDLEELKKRVALLEEKFK